MLSALLGSQLLTVKKSNTSSLMPECQNCGSFVTDEYVRVFAPEGHNNPRVCPSCEDKLRDGAEIREARSKRQ